jgi:butyryl-CoA dehydrogenase
VAWLWLDVARAAVAAGAGTEDAFLRGKRQAARYFVDFELPKIDAWLSVVAARNPACREMQDAWFES